MKTNVILSLDDPNATIENVGGKGASLAQMTRAGFPIPGGFHVTTEAYRQFIAANGLQKQILSTLEVVDYSDRKSIENASGTISEMFLNGTIPDDVANAVVQAYETLPGKSPSVAVRSSATAEDLPDVSFAGQHETYLNVTGAEEVLNATRKCWASLWTTRAMAYRERQNIVVEGIALAVVLQLLVPAEAAGILFTANPINGHLDEMVISASWGLGESVVSGLVTPDMLILEKKSSKLISRETAEKKIQIVQASGGTQKTAVPANMQKVPVLNDEQAWELAELAINIENLYDMPLDIEWALSDGEFAIVQARPITALPDPVSQIPIIWKLPEGAYAAMRNNIVELMIEPLSPLFKTLGLKAVNVSADRMMTGFLGDTGVLPDNPIIAVNEYAYYNGSVKFGPMFKIILDSKGLMERMLIGAVERWTEEGRPKYMETIQSWESQPWQEFSAADILGAAGQLSEAAIDAYMALVSGVLPAAWISEALFTISYNRLIKRRNDPSAPTFLMGYDNIPIRSDKSLYDMADFAKSRSGLVSYLTTTSADQLADELENKEAPSGVSSNDWEEWKSLFQTHLQQFGGAIYNLDFSNTVPADDPTPLLETVKLYIDGQGVNPHTRQQTSAEMREKAVQSVRNRIKGIRLKIFNKTLASAQKYAPLREDGLAEVGLSYPLLRQMLHEMARHFVEGGVIEEIDDIYWLEEDEVLSAAESLDRGEALDDLSNLVPQRKSIWRAAQRAEPPIMLPNKILGLDISKMRSGRGKGKFLKGVPASPGSVTAQACILLGPEDFAKMNAGDVLVAAITTPAWTPLFARAAAVVTDIGGPLSHGSIVAREYGIPAVLGTDVATRRISNGQIITVDGDAGKVFLKDE